MKNSVLIIGAGAVACLSALVLAQRGWRVTVVDRGTVGGEASWAGGGILFPLLPWDYSEPVNQLALAGAARYPQLCDELRDTTGIDPEYQACGMHVLPPFNEHAVLTWCQAHGLKAELQQGRLYLPQVAQVRNPRLMQALKARLLMLGVTLHEHTELLPLQTESGHVTGWRSQDGKNFTADAYVLTAGAWSRPLLGTQALPVELKPMRGQMLLYHLPPGTLKSILFHDDFYLIPRLDGHILAGSTVEDVGFDKSTTAEAARDLTAKAQALLPHLADAPLLHHWSGLRPGSPENQPVIDRHPAIDNLYLNTGHFRYGVTMAPASAEQLTKVLNSEL